jgi:hypothetical protein
VTAAHSAHAIGASRSGEGGTFVTFIYEKESERLLRHVTGTDEDEVILQSLAWSEKSSLAITTEALDRVQGASEDGRSTETELLQKFQNGSAIEEIDTTLEKFYTARRSTRKIQSYRRDPPNAHLATAIIGWMKPGNSDFIGEHGIAKITTTPGRVAWDFEVEPPNVNRSTYFPVFVFLFLFALLLLFSEQFSRFSVPRSMRESGNAIDRATVEKATLINPQATTKRDLQSDLAPVLTDFRRRSSFVGLFLHPVEMNVSANEERVVSFVDSPLNKITRKLRGLRIHLKNHVNSSFNRKIDRPAVNLVTRIHSRALAFYQLGLAHKIGAFVPYRRSIDGGGLFDHKEALATRTNGRLWKKIRSDSRTFERQPAHFFSFYVAPWSLRARTVNAKIQSETLNGFFATAAIFGTINCGRVFWAQGLAGTVSNQELLQPFNPLSLGR